MISWIKDNFGIKNFIVLALVILVIVGFIKGPSWYKLIIRSQYEGVVEAKVANIVAKKASFQHFNGTNTKTVGYDVTYIYEIGNEKFSNTEFIEPDYDIKLILDQFNSGKTSVIEIKYSNETPSKSFISKLNLGK
jgi:hypothetical protein